MYKAPLEIHQGKMKLANAEEVPATIKLFVLIYFFLH